jgi:hypothetical protein
VLRLDYRCNERSVNQTFGLVLLVPLYLYVQVQYMYSICEVQSRSSLPRSVGPFEVCIRLRQVGHLAGSSYRVTPRCAFVAHYSYSIRAPVGVDHELALNATKYTKCQSRVRPYL